MESDRLLDRSIGELVTVEGRTYRIARPPFGSARGRLETVTLTLESASAESESTTGTWTPEA